MAWLGPFCLESKRETGVTEIRAVVHRPFWLSKAAPRSAATTAAAAVGPAHTFCGLHTSGSDPNTAAAAHEQACALTSQPSRGQSVACRGVTVRRAECERREQLPRAARTAASQRRRWLLSHQRARCILLLQCKEQRVIAACPEHTCLVRACDEQTCLVHACKWRTCATLPAMLLNCASRRSHLQPKLQVRQLWYSLQCVALGCTAIIASQARQVIQAQHQSVLWQRQGVAALQGALAQGVALASLLCLRCALEQLGNPSCACGMPADLRTAVEVNGPLSTAQCLAATPFCKASCTT